MQRRNEQLLRKNLQTTTFEFRPISKHPSLFTGEKEIITWFPNYYSLIITHRFPLLPNFIKSTFGLRLWFLIYPTVRRRTTREIAEKIDMLNLTVCLYLQQLGYANKLDVWVLVHELKEIHLTKSINICDSLMNRNQNEPFLKRIIMGDEKWIVYNNVVRKRSWAKKD